MKKKVRKFDVGGMVPSNIPPAPLPGQKLDPGSIGPGVVSPSTQNPSLPPREPPGLPPFQQPPTPVNDSLMKPKYPAMSDYQRSKLDQLMKISTPEYRQKLAGMVKGHYGVNLGTSAGMKKGGKVSSASKRADGIAQRGKTKGKMY